MAGKKSPKFDVNTASKADLVGLNGVGDSLAQKIIDGRPYAKVKDLTRIAGISDKKLDSLLPFLKVETELQVKPPQLESGSKKPSSEKPFTKVGNTEAFVFLEDRSDRQDAFLIIFGGFIFGLIILLLRRHSN
jgi:competence protein ComEA